MKALLLYEIPINHPVPLLDSATKLYNELWTGAAGLNILVPIARTYTKWRVGFWWTQASKTHTTQNPTPSCP